MDSVESVAAQSLGSNAATDTAYYTFLAAEATSSSPVDIIAYSGGAGAFAAAWNLLSAAQQADIGSIVYLTPGSLGELVADQRVDEHFCWRRGTRKWHGRFGDHSCRICYRHQLRSHGLDLFLQPGCRPPWENCGAWELCVATIPDATRSGSGSRRGNQSDATAAIFVMVAESQQLLRGRGE